MHGEFGADKESQRQSEEKALTRCRVVASREAKKMSRAQPRYFG